MSNQGDQSTKVKQLFKDSVLVKVDDIVPDPNNPNKMTKEQAQALLFSLEKFNDVVPIVVDSKTMMIADGHHRLEAYKTMGIREIHVIKKDFKNNAERILFAQTMNKLRGQHDKAMDIDVVYALVNGSDENLQEYMRLMAIQDEGIVLNYLQKQHPDFNISSRKPEDQEKLAELVNFETKGTEPPITQKGDLWRLGDHILMCGDSTSQRDLNKLFDGETVKPDLVFADPPYNIGFSYNEYEDERSEEDYEKFCSDWFIAALKQSAGNVILTPGPRNVHFYFNMRSPDDIGTWYKPNSRSGASFFYFRRCEPILFYGTPPKRKRTDDYFEFNRDDNRNIKQVEKEAGVEDFAPFKPVSLIVELLDFYSTEGQTVFDPFMGSGTTVIACEQTRRKAYGMEQDPRYCDVIIKRWELYTNRKAEKILV